MILESIGIGTIIALNTGLVEISKRINPNEKYIPLVSLATGVLLMTLCSIIPEMDITFVQAIISGIMVGLMSVGAYSGVKNIAEDVKK